MNIFYTDKDPIQSAINIYRADKRRALKCIAECMQGLACTCYEYGAEPPIKKDGKPYGKKYPPKPFQEWLRHAGNVQWLLIHLITINQLNKKNHASLINEHSDNIKKIYKLISLLPKDETPFPNYAMAVSKNLDFTYIEDVPTAYKMYLNSQGITI